MKHLLLSCLLIPCCFAAGAQAAYPNDIAVAEVSSKTAPAPAKASAPAASRVVYMTPEKQWAMIEMKQSGNAAYFYHIEDLSALRVYITDGEGRTEADLKVSAAANGIDISNLHSGLHFVTLVNEHTDEKRIFMLHL